MPDKIISIDESLIKKALPVYDNAFLF